MREQLLSAVAVAVNNSEQEGKVDVRYSPIGYDNNGDTYIIIDNDILNGVPKDREKNTVRKFIKDNFPTVQTSDGEVLINAQSRGEFTNSKYTRMLERTAEDDYRNKLRSANNLDEIIQNRTNVRREDAKHTRKDDIVDFDSGDVNIVVGNKVYKAKVQIGIRKDGSRILNDILDFDITNKNAADVTRVSPNTDNSGMNHQSASDPNISQPNPFVKENIRYSRDIKLKFYVISQY